MFTQEHLIWLLIVIIIVSGLLVLNKFKKLKYNFVLNLVFFICLAGELIKMFSNMEDAYGGGKILDPSDLPFHLCSVQLFFMFFLKVVIKNESTKEKLLGFMAPIMLVGAFLAIMIPTVGVKFNKPQVYEYFIYHAMLIFFALYILIEKMVKYDWKSFLRNLGFLGIMAMCSFYINSILSKTNEKVNFMYLSRPPMENLPLLNLNHGWAVYVMILGILGVSFMFIYHLIMIIIQKKVQKM